MCLSEVSLLASVLPSWRVHTCFCSSPAPNETSLYFLCSTTETSFSQLSFFRALMPQNVISTGLFGWPQRGQSFSVYDLWFWWKTPESEDSLVSHSPYEGVCLTSCHYWKREKTKKPGWFTLFTSICRSLVLHFLLQRVSLSNRWVF